MLDPSSTVGLTFVQDAGNVAPVLNEGQTGVTNVTQRREALLETGLELFSHRPYDELGIDDIAAAAGVAKGLLYYYFGSKRGFYVACVERAVAELRVLEDRTDIDDLSPAAGFARRLDAYLTYVEGHSEGFVTMLAGGVGADREVRSILEREHDDRIALMCQTLAATDPPAQLLLTALRGWIGYVEAVSLQWLTSGSLDRATVRELLLRSLPGVLAAIDAVDRSALSVTGRTLAAGPT
jgi:AcrR family transcriptional regulator